MLINFIFFYWFLEIDEFAGRFIPNANLIIIKAEKVSPSYLLHVARHEYGHYVWYEKLNKTQRKEFEVLSLKYKANETVDCFWGHNNSTREDFADSYTYFTGDLEIFNFIDCKDKLNFMIENIE